MALHREAAKRYGGIPTQRDGDFDCIDGHIGSAVNAAYYFEGGNQDMGLIVGAHLLYYIAGGHCFVDGNKRTGWLACVEFFKNLQLTVNATEDEAYDLVMAIAAKDSRITSSEVAVWLAERLEAVEGEMVN
jgi:prophage maintenance system killer protein